MWWVMLGLVQAGTFDHHESGRFYKALSCEDRAVRQVARSVVWFDRGTGFVVSPSGHVLTNAHVAELEGEHTSVAVPGGRWVDLVLVARADELDVALYRRSEPVPTSSWVTLRADAPERGEAIAVIGNPAGLPMRVSFGEIVEPKLRPQTRHLPPAVGYSAVAWWGSSGSPVIDREGRVVAVHWGWDRWAGKPFAGVPMSEILEGFPALRDVISDCPEPDGRLRIALKAAARGLRARIRGPSSCVSRIESVRWFNRDDLLVAEGDRRGGRAFVQGPLPLHAEVVLEAGRRLEIREARAPTAEEELLTLPNQVPGAP